MKVLKVVAGSGIYYTNTHKDIPYGSDVQSYTWLLGGVVAGCVLICSLNRL